MKRLLIIGFLFTAVVSVLLSCQKELSFESNDNTATFTIHDDSTLACYPITVNGTYYNGVSANRDTNFIKIVVNVKSTGNYNISSISENGFSFADSGFFSKTGVDTLTLHAVGTPILIKTTDFTVEADTLGICSFSIDVQDSTGTGLGDTTGGVTPTPTGSYSATYVDPSPAGDDTWHFFDSTTNQTFEGNVTLGQFADNGDNTSTFAFQGFVTNDANLSFTLAVTFPTTSIATGSYQVDGLGTALLLANLTTSNYDYTADASTVNESADPSYINITSYDAATKRIKGSFRCWAVDANNNPVLIKGSFNSIIT